MLKRSTKFLFQKYRIFLLLILIKIISSSNDIIYINSDYSNQINHKNGNCTITIEDYYSVIPPH